MKIFLNIFLTLLSLHDVEGYLVSPPGTPAPGAAEGCSAWVESSYSLTCDIVSRFYGMSLAQFEAWVSKLPVIRAKLQNVYPRTSNRILPLVMWEEAAI
jgi:hypothetical protein